MAGELAPSGWSTATLADVAAQVTSGATPRSGSSRYYTEYDGLRFAKIDDLTASPDRYLAATKLRITPRALRENALTLYPPGTVLISMYGTVGLVKTTKRRLAANQALAALIPPFSCNADYLACVLIWSCPAWDKYKSQTTQANISGRIVKEFSIPLPPLPEQRRIAAILDTLDTAIRTTERLIAKLELVKHGLLHDLLTRGIDANGELRDPERHPEQFQDSLLGLIPREWEVLPLDAVAEVRSGIAKNARVAVSRPVLVPYLRVANVQDGYLDLMEMQKIMVSRDLIERYQVLPGDVLMNEGGDLDKLGRGSIWRGQIRLCVHQNHVFVVRSGPRVIPEFLNASTSATTARRYFMMVGKQTTNLASINKTAIEQTPLVLPKTIEQRAIVEILDTHDERIRQAQVEVAKLRTLKHGLMDDLLTGRVRVTGQAA